MPFRADLHIHSRYSLATSRDMTPEVLWRWAQMKGIRVIGTGDFTHPAWISELKEKTAPTGEGLLTLRKKFMSGSLPASCRGEVFFMLSAEVSCIFKKHGKTRKTHSLILARDFVTVEKINSALSRIGNLRGDGRPILGLDAKELLRIVLSVPGAMLVPAHAWTPHFSVFGSRSGFDSLEECYEELTPHVRAIETGLSSDPEMNWRLSSLDRISLISNSDAHSPERIGREMNVLDTEISYDAITDAIATGKGLESTVEFFPEQGKYHFDGHRACSVAMSPAESRERNSICPGCGKKVTMGVLHRVEELADRAEGYRPANPVPFTKVVPLADLLSAVLAAGRSTKKIRSAYFTLLDSLGSEYDILLDSPTGAVAEFAPELACAIGNMRSGRVRVTPGFDGEYGKIETADGPGGTGELKN